MSAPKVGDRVRVTYEGVVTGFFEDWLRVRVTSPAGDQVSAAVFPDTFAIEVLEPAPPAWWPPKRGDLIEDFGGDSARDIGFVVHDGDDRIEWSRGGACRVSSYKPTNPPRLLFRDGKPYVDGAE